jgi:serine/threonine-protein kinase
MALALENAMAPATASEVGAWVERVAGPTLARRAAEVAAIESGAISVPQASDRAPPSPALTPAPTSSEVATESAPRRRRWVIVAVVGALLLGSIVAVAVSHGSHPHPEPAPVAASQRVAPTPSPASPSVAEVTTPSAAPAETAPPAPSASSEVPRLGATARAKPAPRTRPASGCDTPYTWDDQGRKHYKPECL